MKLKSYFSGTVEAAMELARRELGEDALIVNARPATPETKHLGAYEVVFAAPGAAQTEAPPIPDRFSQELADMKREIERLSHRLNAVPQMRRETEACSRLLENELHPMIAQAVNSGTPLEEFFEIDATLGRRGAERAVVALVGPPGVGKTTTLVKLAARFGLASRRPAQIISADVFRIAAADQLRTLAGILGVGCDVVETPVALAQALEEHRSKDFIFIDTPGLARDDMEDGLDLARFLSSHPDIDTHLVVAASMRPADLARVIDRYRVFQPSKLLFTRLDETASFGSIVNEASRSKLPLSFFTTGQQIPDDLEPASAERLAALIGGPAASPRVTAAGA